MDAQAVKDSSARDRGACGPTEVTWLRAQWVEALEGVLAVVGPHAFMRWMERHVRPVLRYEMVICATGTFAPTNVAADRLLVRGFPQRYLDSVRDGSGVIVLPRGVARNAASLRTVDLASGPCDLGIVVALDVPDTATRYGSYFLFGRLPALPDAHQCYVTDLIAPHMRATLAHLLLAEPALRPQLSAHTPLTRRELELLQWLVAGRTTGEIARSTFRSTHTVSNQVRAILRKLRANNRTEAIAVALGLGLVAPQERQSQTRVMAAQPQAIYRLPRSSRAARGLVSPVPLARETVGCHILRLDT
jgi:DNA-binding CsgD family transcriptional regulator